MTGNIIHNTGVSNAALSDKQPGEAAIVVSGGAPSHGVSITNNTIHNARSYGIHMENLRGGIVAHNIIESASDAILRKDCADNLVEKNIEKRIAPAE